MIPTAFVVPPRQKDRASEDARGKMMKFTASLFAALLVLFAAASAHPVIRTGR